MNPEMESRVNGTLNIALCRLLDRCEEIEKKKFGRHHYGCAFELRGDKVFHLCSELKKEWEIKE